MESADLYDGSAREVARRLGVSRRTVMARRQRARIAAQLEEAQRIRQQADAVDLARAAATDRDRAEHRADELRGRLVEREEYIAALEQALDRMRELHTHQAARAERWAKEVRELRKRAPMHRQFMMLGFAVYDLLPPSVWVSVLAGHDVEATFRGAMVDEDERVGWLAMDQRGLDIMGEFVETLGEHAEMLRMVVAVRESIDMDEEKSQTDKARTDRFNRWAGTELYGDVGDD